ncbi:hypothetical protein BG006_011325 [Podila minutissima]|uniref:Uncharacterized protein n=1 Tax=Podila minutissima TaxID=64525 RepID=A0A9P5SEB2_9FUNG|nr:hypothetical protein BG006_011325 [Podila minutissima]
MRLASYTLLILGAVTAKVLAKPVQKLTLQQLDELVQKNVKIMVEWNVAACTVRAEFASHGDLQDIVFVSLDYDTIFLDHMDQVNTYQATIGLDVKGTYQGVDDKQVADLLQNLAAA